MVNLKKRNTLTLNKFEKSFTILFFIIVIIELCSTSLSALSSFHNISKPLILASLLLFFYFKSEHLTIKTKRLMLLALTMSLIGDVFLMFDEISPNYFIAGLLSFLLAHLFYILVFIDKRNNKQRPLVFFAILIFYTFGLLYLLRNGLGAMLIPVIVYVFAILSMAITASLRKGKVSPFSYNLVLIGALLFLISDSFVAINKFYSDIPSEHLIIMSTYSIAQYCIVMGVLKQEN